MADQEAASSRLMDWYGKLPSRRVDLVGDYAGQELFIVEGDGLLLRCFDDPALDFASMSLESICMSLCSDEFRGLLLSTVSI